MKTSLTFLGTFLLLGCISMFIPTSFGNEPVAEQATVLNATVTVGEPTINTPADISEYLQEVYQK